MSALVLLAVIAASGGDRYHATELYCTTNADTPANTLFSGRLVGAIYERAVSFPVWDRAGGGQAISYLELINTDGGLDSWLSDDWKDVRITLKVVERRAAYSTATQVGVCVIDRLEAPDAGRIRFVCRSVFERLEKVISTVYPDTINNVANRGKPRPMTLGSVRWMDPVCSTLANSVGDAGATYDVADSCFEGITELRNRGGFQDAATQALILLSTDDYFVVDSTADGFGFRHAGTTNRLAAQVAGQVRLGTQMFTNESFASGATGWTTVEDGASTVTFGSGQATLIGAADYASLYQVITTVAGRVYQIEADVASTATDGATFYVGGSTLRTFYDVTTMTLTTYFVASGGSTIVGVRIPPTMTGGAVLNSLKCYEAYRINSLAEVAKFAGVTRGALSSGDIDSTALAAIDTAAGYAIGWHSNGEEVRGIDLVTLVAQSFGVAIFQDASGLLAPVRIAEPAVSEDFSLDELSILEISWEADTAPGLSTRMYYGRNYAPHSADDTGSLTPTTSTIAQLIADLQGDVLTVTTTETLHAVYADAEARDPLDSVLSAEADAQDEIDRICALYTQPRAFYTVKAFVESGTVHTIEPGNTVAVTHSRYGLSAGVNLLVVAARSDFLGNAVDLVLWG